MAQWVGFGVSVRCGSPLGCYQGTILAADGASITLTKPFRNGFPYPKAQVTLKASDIKSLEIISGKTSGGTAHSTVPVAGKKRVPRATVGESLQEQAPAPPPPPPVANKGKPARSKPIDIQAKNRSNTHAGSYGAGASGSTPKAGGRAAGGDKARRRNEACFGSAALEAVDDDFDFEGNLALFDKEALWQQMRPDVVRVAAAREELAAAAGAGAGEGGGKLRHDQNVLRGAPPDTAPVAVPPALRGVRDYVTDSGTRLPSVCAALRARLWAALRRTDDETQHAARALYARAAADVALKLVGGTRRLDPRNAHQRPCAGVAAGSGPAAAAAVAAARVLRAHGVDTYVVPLDDTCPLVTSALTAYRLSGGRVLAATEPRPAADLLLLALHDPETSTQHPSTPLVLAWACSSRGALVVVEPGGGESEESGQWEGVLVAARAALAALLPPALPAPAPRLLLANVAPPAQLFAAAGVAYRSPFGAASVLPLHLADDDD
ncbi:enhancer of mRNA-decapping protein 3 isoform X2 [Leguminivora glycinivorella]|uniref:enhancer of mRNA-decapping protein 3 isoform X2 n=1 Tax=Leguminivora glycinivorella TaxID=1035111 RepID=UPI00200BC0FE|nr:enhancer of mRNA-decapping protein 3 isoform X2 [Leguminivora glycinivorella]